MLRRVSRWLAAVAVCTLAACGGGGTDQAGTSVFSGSAGTGTGVGTGTSTSTTAKADEVAGHGLQLTDARGRVWSLGRPGWMTDDGASGDAIFSRDGLTLAAFRFQEALRPETVDAFNALRREGFDMHLLSGDRTEKVAETARTLGLSRSAWHSQMTPAEKAAHVRSLDNRNTLYLGDGANDSLAFEAALCTGSPVTGRNFLEHKADFYFLGNSLRFVPQLLQAARDRQRAVRRIFAFALSYNIATVAVSLSGHMSPLLAAVLMPLSSIATIALVRLSFKAPVAARNQYQRQSLRSAPQGMVGDNDGALVT